LSTAAPSESELSGKTAFVKSYKRDLRSLYICKLADTPLPAVAGCAGGVPGGVDDEQRLQLSSSTDVFSSTPPLRSNFFLTFRRDFIFITLPVLFHKCTPFTRYFLALYLNAI